MTEIEELELRVAHLENFIWRHADRWDDINSMIKEGSLVETILDTVDQRVYLQSPSLSIDRP